MRLKVIFISGCFLIASCGQSERKSGNSLHDCIWQSCPVSEFEELVLKSDHVDSLDSAGRTPLMLAAGAAVTISDRESARHGRIGLGIARRAYVEVLLNAGAQVNVVDKQGSTALLAAIYNGDGVVVAALLRAGASPNEIPNSMSPLLLSAVHCDSAIGQILIEAGAIDNDEISTEWEKCRNP